MCRQHGQYLSPLYALSLLEMQLTVILLVQSWPLSLATQGLGCPSARVLCIQVAPLSIVGLLCDVIQLGLKRTSQLAM
jgi:hypothetical protein